mgnify:CR=1 FL=1
MAPIVLLNLLRWLKTQKPTVELHIVLARTGVLESAFEELGEIYHWRYKRVFWNLLQRFLPRISFLKWKQRVLTWQIQQEKFDLVYGNTV